MHMNGLSPVWVLMWFLTRQENRKVLPHTGHEGLFPCSSAGDFLPEAFLFLSTTLFIEDDAGMAEAGDPDDKNTHERTLPLFAGLT